MSGSSKYKLIVISSVKPFPGTSGQQVRVRNSLIALRQKFEITFLTFSRLEERESVRKKLEEYADYPIVLESLTQRNFIARAFHRLFGGLNTFITGLKYSNYALGRVELSPSRIDRNCSIGAYDLALFEYWHTNEAAVSFRKNGVPTVLDMHDVLWKTYALYLNNSRNPLYRLFARRFLEQYRSAEEKAWREYDAIIAISKSEAAYLRKKLPDKTVIDTPMGINLDDWKYTRNPSHPPRFAFYGSMKNEVNQNAALHCFEKIMPVIWKSLPDSQFYIIGGDPPEKILKLKSHPGVEVTGFVENPAEVMSQLTAVLCPWSGEFGFRSRLIEVMAVGCPVAANPDAVKGMALEEGEGIFIGKNDADLADHCIRLANDPGFAMKHSESARRQVENKFSFDATYGVMANNLYELVSEAKASQGAVNP